jgi:DNA ligase-1
VRFDELATFFARLEASGRRLRAVQLVADLLGRARPDELAFIVYLLQGQLRPPYEGVELGLGERLLLRAVARAYDLTEPAVTRRYRRLGDLGLVAEAVAGGARGGRLTVGTAYGALLEIARSSGAGAIARKTELFAALLRRAGPLEAKYLVRTAQGRLRLGIGDATVVEATAAGALGDRRKKRLVEQAYNVRSDLGSVVRLAYTKGERVLVGIGPQVGIPFRPALAQRLPSAAAIIERLGIALVEPKYDGFRLQLHRDGARIWIFSRRLEDVSAMFPELTAAAHRQLRARRAIIENQW